MNLIAEERANIKREKEFIATVQREYERSLEEIKARIAKEYMKYGIKDGTLSIQTMQKMSLSSANKITRLEQLYKDIDENLTDLTKWQNTKIKDDLEDTYKTTKKINEQAVSDLTNLSFKKISKEQVYEAINNPLLDITIKDNEQTIKTNIRRAMTSSIVQGEGIVEMASRITKVMETTANRAVKIARTETTRVVNKAREETYKEAIDMGINVQKKWLSALDERTRPSHLNVNGEIREMDQPFSNGLMKPGDESGPASEVINCRCVIIGVLPDYEDVNADYNSKRPSNKTSDIEEVKLAGGFPISSEVKDMDQELMKLNTKQFDKLEAKYGVAGKSDGFSIQFESTEYFKAHVNTKLTNLKKQTMYLSKDFYGVKDKLKLSDGKEVLKGRSMPCSPKNYSVYTLTHEYGHMVENVLLHERIPQIYKLEKDLRYGMYYKETIAIKDEIMKIALDSATENDVLNDISKYGMSNAEEFFAEAFANSQLGKPNIIGKAMSKYLEEVWVK